MTAPMVALGRAARAISSQRGRPAVARGERAPCGVVASTLALRDRRTMKLYYAPKTSAFRCRWMLEELGAPHELVNVSLQRGEHKRPEYLKIHPLGSVPALVDGDNNFIESAAIVMHLADKDPEQRFAPAPGSPERGHYYQWILFAMTNLYQVIHTPYLRYFFRNESAFAAASDAGSAT